MGNVTVQRLGQVKPAVEPDWIDARPIVLWSRNSPAAVFSYRLDSDPEQSKAAQYLEPVYGDGLQPIVVRGALPPEAETEALLDLVDPGFILTADVDGDGTEELILARRLGAVDVYSAREALFRFGAPSMRPELATYEPRYSLVVRLKGRDVVYLLLRRVIQQKDVGEAELVRAGLGSPTVVVRIDRQGVARLVLGDVGWNDAEVVSLGAISRPGSEGIDELLVIGRPESSPEAYLARHRPDGRPIDSPRKIYVPFPDGGSPRFRFLPQSDKAVITDPTSGFYVVSPSKPANWIRFVDLAPIMAKGPLEFLQVTDADSEPKVLVLVDREVYAVDEEGEYFSSHGGTWAGTKTPQPLYTIVPPSPQHELVRVVPSPSEPGQFLVVQSRKRQPRRLPREELLWAAEKFLPDGELAIRRENAVPRLAGQRAYRDSQIEQEQERLGLANGPAAEEDWQRRFPDSYQAVKEYLETNLQADLTSALLRPVESWHDLDRTRLEREYRNVDEYLAWLQGLMVDDETSFTLVTGGSAGPSFQVGGHHPLRPETQMGRGAVDFRAGAGAVSVVLMLGLGDESGNVGTGFFWLQQR